MEPQKQSIISAPKALRVRGYAEDCHVNMITDLEATVGDAPFGKNKQALSNTAALNKRVVHPKSAVAKDNKAALSFISALKRI